MLLFTCADVGGWSQAQALTGIRHCSHLSLNPAAVPRHTFKKGQAGCSGADSVACSTYALNGRVTSADIVSWPHLREKWLPLSPLPAVTEEVTGVVVDPAGPAEIFKNPQPKKQTAG